MQSSIIDNKIKKKKEEKEPLLIQEETQEKYLRRHFLRNKEEYRVDFNLVGENRFRINFWKYIDNKNSYYKNSFISRSYYVVLSKKDLSWSHEIRDF